MKNSTSLIIFSLLILLLSCTSNNNENSNAGSLVGVYDLTSIVSDTSLDPDVTGTFSDTELIDNLDCNSAMTLAANGTISWNYLNITQNLETTTAGTVYSAMECEVITGGTGQYIVNYQGVAFDFDSSLGVTEAFTFGDLIKVKVAKLLVVRIADVPQLRMVNLTLTYTQR